MQPLHSTDAAPRIELHHAVLSDLAGSKPKRLVRSMRYQAEDIAGAEPYASEADFQQALRAAEPGDQLIEMWRKQLTQWDFMERPEWSTTDARTEQRRIAIYEALEVTEETAKLLGNACPVALADAPVVISKDFTPWRKKESRHGREWYWPHYSRLLSEKGWPEEAVAALDIASECVVERLADPTRPDAYQSKGLVVGYVQSGKTANFTGVIAKGIDAGYRLVIVLGGTLNLLRDQTQRRLDKELVGRENIMRGASEFDTDYYDDPEWLQRKFVEFGDTPSALGGFDIVRLTTRHDDYKALLQGIVALEFEKQEPAVPLYDARNLHRSAARLMVVKKNKSVLAKLVKDLKKIRTPLAEIPVLIIDDESDEASVNTSRPKPDSERTAINQKISELLTLLPRAQYVGYTATPYANVFIDPSDTADIFPKDFIISLPRPTGYMGASDFHDFELDEWSGDRTFANSNELAHVRDVKVADEDDTGPLEQAIDTFVLTAAMKLFRQDRDGLGEGYFRHHTMLIHESNWLEVHRELLGHVTKLWWGAGYSSSRGHERLRALFESDIAPVSRARSADFSVPRSYDELMPYVGPAVMNIGADQRPIIVVNGDQDIETGEADFDRRPIWKILIGGQKLSRGFTVEGLTVSYFRRRSTNASALMQMGRWFGFRNGYRDLVRLYIGREEEHGKQDIDLYKAFEAVCMDEETFRRELEQYAVLVDGVPQVTPAQVPPLVSQHLPLLKPTSPNKMYNAKLVEIQSAGQWEEPTAYPSAAADLRYNSKLWLPILESMPPETVQLSYAFGGKLGTHSYPARVGTLTAAAALDLFESLRWRASSQFEPHLAYLREITRSGMVDDWIVLAPQHKAGKRTHLGTSADQYSWFERDRRRDPLFGAISDPKHRGVAYRIAGALTDSGDPYTERLVADRRGVTVVYPMVERVNRVEASSGTLDPSHVVMGFGFVAPASARTNDRLVRFSTIDSSEEAIVEIH
ncbi:Z1 domain-containing protein [Nocardia yamanashiensis]|uniref:Z1 domain-containing protein n=1 Tax=Nocardia yamanashiensis TaxID=209247 RepID=UPI001E344CCD|nr:Z1 domain-containing protein [Nocardia yamanashiensis]UGT42000.1 Z1 domain-containing protein [Nocardia yamanashiensis]